MDKVNAVLSDSYHLQMESGRNIRQPSPRHKILHRDPFNLNFANTSRHNEVTHRSQREYFIPQKEIVKDWVCTLQTGFTSCFCIEQLTDIIIP